MADQEMTDQRAIDVIALGLGTKTEWDSGELEWIAEVIGEVRPHPGDTEGDYVIAFEDATERDAEEFIELETEEIRASEIEPDDVLREIGGLVGWFVVEKRDDHAGSVLVWTKGGSQFMFDRDEVIERRSTDG